MLFDTPSLMRTGFMKPPSRMPCFIHPSISKNSASAACVCDSSVVPLMAGALRTFLSFLSFYFISFLLNRNTWSVPFVRSMGNE